MDDTELQSIVRSEVEDAITFIDSEIGPQRAKAVDYYFGRPFGDEEDGRSQVVSRDVHDTIHATLPSLMRIFFGPERVVEFQPHGPEDVEQAEQQTDYVTYIVTQDNDGFMVFHAVTKNALREKVGFVKYWWDDSVTVSTHRYTGLDEMALTKLVEDLGGAEEAEIVESWEEEIDGQPTMSVKLKVKRKCDRVKIEAVPPEELLISRDGKSLEEARLVAHRTEKTVSELIAMGYDRDTVEAAAGNGDDDLSTSEERIARNPWADTSARSGGEGALRKVLYIEAYPLIDYDDDGIAELRRVCMIGSGYNVVLNEECDERPFADFHCDPEPHTFFGQSQADQVTDVQRIKSVVLRAGLDSLAQNIFPRTIVVEGDGNLEDAANTEVGALLRAKSPNGYVPLAAQDLSGAALPYLSYMDELRENRTGQSKVSQGLDAEALQNTTATAAEGQFARSQERIELIARVMASGMRKLFRGILRLVVENQRAARVLKLRNTYVPVDPRRWRADMDVFCAIGLGGGSQAEKLAVLNMTAEKQEQILLQLGPNNPLVSLKQYHNTLTKMLELGGQRAPAMFFTDPDSEEAQARAQAAGPPPEDPDVVKAKGQLELERQKAEANVSMTREKAQIDAETAAMKHQMDAEAAEREAQRKHELAIAEMQAQIDLKRYQVDQELMLKREQLVAELELKRELGMAQAAVAAETGMARVNASTSGVEPGGEAG